MDFKGFKQYTKEKFDELTPAQKKGTLSLVQEYNENNEVVKKELHFGNRLYGDVLYYDGDDSEEAE